MFVARHARIEPWRGFGVSNKVAFLCSTVTNYAYLDGEVQFLRNVVYSTDQEEFQVARSSHIIALSEMGVVFPK